MRKMNRAGGYFFRILFNAGKCIYDTKKFPAKKVAGNFHFSGEYPLAELNRRNVEFL